MNQAQVNNLIQTSGKLLAGVLAAKGYQDSSAVEDGISIIMAIVAWWFSHIAHTNTPNKPTT